MANGAGRLPHGLGGSVGQSVHVAGGLLRRGHCSTRGQRHRHLGRQPARSLVTHIYEGVQLKPPVISRAVRSPSRIDKSVFPISPPFILQSNPDYKSEELIAYELGYRVQAHKNISLSLATFYNDYDHIRSLEPIPRPPGYPPAFPSP